MELDIHFDSSYEPHFTYYTAKYQTLELHVRRNPELSKLAYENDIFADECEYIAYVEFENGVLHLFPIIRILSSSKYKDCKMDWTSGFEFQALLWLDEDIRITYGYGLADMFTKLRNKMHMIYGGRK